MGKTPLCCMIASCGLINSPRDAIAQERGNRLKKHIQCIQENFLKFTLVRY